MASIRKVLFWLFLEGSHEVGVAPKSLEPTDIHELPLVLWIASVRKSVVKWDRDFPGGLENSVCRLPKCTGDCSFRLNPRGCGLTFLDILDCKVMDIV